MVFLAFGFFFDNLRAMMPREVCRYASAQGRIHPRCSSRPAARSRVCVFFFVLFWSRRTGTELPG